MRTLYKNSNSTRTVQTRPVRPVDLSRCQIWLSTKTNNLITFANQSILPFKHLLPLAKRASSSSMCPAFRVFACTNIAHTRSSPMNHRYFTNPAVPISDTCVSDTLILRYFLYTITMSFFILPYRRIVVPVSSYLYRVLVIHSSLGSSAKRH